METAAALSNSFSMFFHDLLVVIRALVWVLTGISPRLYKWLFDAVPRFRLAIATMKSMLEGFISETQVHVVSKTPTARCALSDILRQLDDKVFDAALVDEILELVIVGHETTVSTTAWGLNYLADNQQVQQRLYDALKSDFPAATDSSLPSGLEISRAEIPYLDAVIAEILRISCTAPVLFREILRVCEIMGYYVPARTPVFLITQSPALT